MKQKLILAIAVVSALLVAGCVPVPVAKTYVCPDGSQVSDAALCQSAPAKTPGNDTNVRTVSSSTPSTEPKTPPVQDKVVVIKDLTPDAKKLIDRSIKAKNVQFNYFNSIDNYTQNEYFADRTRMKVVLTAKEVYNAKNPYDVVYLDFASKTALAYCESESEGLCRFPEESYKVSYDKYNIKTPFQWLDLVEKASLTGRTKTFEGMTLKEAKFEAEGKQGTLWLDSYFGMPIEVNYEGVLYRYANAFMNEVKETELAHQPRAE